MAHCKAKGLQKKGWTEIRHASKLVLMYTHHIFRVSFETVVFTKQIYYRKSKDANLEERIHVWYRYRFFMSGTISTKGQLHFLLIHSISANKRKVQ